MIWIIAVLSGVIIAIVLAVALKVLALLKERLSQVTQAVQDTNKTLNANLGSTASLFGNVKEQLGRLEVTNQQIIQISRDITSLQELLRAPKFRGAMGETLLENLLSQILPSENYLIQFSFKTGDTVDAAIRLGERLVPVDAKFSLENFQKSLEAQDEQQKSVLRKRFAQDVKDRINEIASRYILPQEDTYDFALMYIPAENVYYEIIVKEDLFSYSLSKRVIPVSPNTIYAYLQVICMGLKGFKIEENARLILKNLSALSLEIGKFKDDFDKMGMHLANASSKYSEAQKRLDRFSDRLANIQEKKPIASK
jgi:DNA recombination protein RmuC